MSQITLRKIPDALDRRLRQLSRQSRSSLNKTIISLLLKALGYEGGSLKKRNLSALAGTWSAAEAKEFEKNTLLFEQIDTDIWST